MGILKHLLGGGHGSRHGYGSHGNRHGQNGSYGDPNLNPQPRQAALACGARSVLRAMRCIADAGRVQCRATLAPAASFCGSAARGCGLERPRAARRCVARMRDAVLMAVSTRAQDALTTVPRRRRPAVSARWPALAWRRPVRERPARHAALRHAHARPPRIPWRARSRPGRPVRRPVCPATWRPVPAAARGGARRQEQGAGRGLGGGGVLARQRGAVGIATAAMTIVGAQDRDGIAGGDDEGSDHQKYGLSLRASMQSKTTTKAKVGEASVQIAQDSNSQVRHGRASAGWAGRRQRRAASPAPRRRARAGGRWRPSCRCWVCPRIARRHSVRWAGRRRARTAGEAGDFPVHTYRRFRACESAQFFRNTVRRGDACSGPLLSIRLRAFSMCERMMLRAPSASCSRIKR